MIPALPDLALLRPWWLVSIPLLLLAGWFALRRARSLGTWERAFDPQLLAAMERLGRIVPGRAGRAALPVAAALVIGLALSGPAWRAEDPQTYRNLDGVVLAVDVSRSIVEGGSLDDAQAAAQLMLQRVGGRPTALIVYAGEAYIASAFTTDALALGPTLAVLDGETVPNPGSRSDRALNLAARLFEEAGILSGDVVLVTDGDHLTPEAYATARDLAGKNIHVSAFFVEPTARMDDMPAADEAALRRLTVEGDGFLADATAPVALADAVGRRAASALAEGAAAVLLYRDFGRWLLALALVPALLLFRRTV